MIRIAYKDIELTETSDDVSIYNLKISDQFKNLQSFCQSSLAWLRNDSTRNYQDLEKLLRQLDLDTHLIAKPVDFGNISEIKSKLFIPNRQTQPTDLEYMLLVSCRNKEDALKELSLFHVDYEENYKCLEKTGCYAINQSTELKDFNDFKYNPNENPNEDLILNSKLKYDFVKVTGKESINTIIEDLVLKYNKEPEKIICGKLGSDDIYALTINGEISSPIGWVEHSDDYKLIDFRMLKKTG